MFFYEVDWKFFRNIYFFYSNQNLFIICNTEFEKKNPKNLSNQQPAINQHSIIAQVESTKLYLYL